MQLFKRDQSFFLLLAEPESKTSNYPLGTKGETGHAQLPQCSEILPKPVGVKAKASFFAEKSPQGCSLFFSFNAEIQKDDEDEDGRKCFLLIGKMDERDFRIDAVRAPAATPG